MLAGLQPSAAQPVKPSPTRHAEAPAIVRTPSIIASVAFPPRIVARALRPTRRLPFFGTGPDTGKMALASQVRTAGQPRRPEPRHCNKLIPRAFSALRPLSSPPWHLGCGRRWETQRRLSSKQPTHREVGTQSHGVRSDLTAGLPKDGRGNRVSQKERAPCSLGSRLFARLPARARESHGARPARAAIAALLGLALSSCGTAEFSTRDLRVSASGDQLYVFARNSNVSRDFCAALGGDVARVEGWLASADTRSMRLGRVMCCYTARPLAVCAQDDAECLADSPERAPDGVEQARVSLLDQIERRGPGSSTGVDGEGAAPRQNTEKCSPQSAGVSQILHVCFRRGSFSR